MVSQGKAQEINSLNKFILGVNAFSDDEKRGQFTIEQKKKKRELIEEKGKRVDIPADVGEQEKKALDQTGDDATQGW